MNRLNDTKDLLNWAEVSRMFTGTRQGIRKNKIPKKHQGLINELCLAMDIVLAKYDK